MSGDALVGPVRSRGGVPRRQIACQQPRLRRDRPKLDCHVRMLLCDDTGALPKMGSSDRESNNGIDPTAAIRGTYVGAITCRENSWSGRQREFTDGRLELSDSFAGLRICNVCTRHGHSFVSPGARPVWQPDLGLSTVERLGLRRRAGRGSSDCDRSR
jgi:hypothetical protein